MHMFRHIDASRHGDVAVVKILAHRLVDGPPLEELRAEVGQVVGDLRGVNLLIDLAAVDFLSSAMLDTLCQLYRRLHAAGGQLKLCRLNQSIAEVFRITNLDRLFPIHADAAEALASF